MNKPDLPNNCAINERTADGLMVGRCCYHLKNGKCPRHGDVSKQQEEYLRTGKLQEDPRPGKKKQEAP